MIRKTNITQFNSISELDNIKFNITRDSTSKFEQYVCQNIITFDIETSNLFVDPKTHIAEGFSFDKALSDPKYYKRLEPISCMYIWQCAVETFDHYIKVFHGRTWESFDSFLNHLTENVRLAAFSNEQSIKVFGREECLKTVLRAKQSVRMFIDIHNLSFEFGHLRNLYNEEFAYVSRNGRGATFARSARKPMKTFLSMNKVKCEFRDTYVLTQKSLAHWCEDNNLPIKKLEEPKDYYLKIRTPLSTLTQEDFQYSINDVVCMVYGIDEYRTKYHTMENIPLTQTGTVRRVCVERIAQVNPAWSSLCTEITKNYTLDFFRHLTEAFLGGWTHANALYTGQTLHNVRHFDFASSYPTVMTTRTFPIFGFKKCDISEYDSLVSQDLQSPELEYHYMLTVKITDFTSNTENTFWSSSKCKIGSLMGWFEDGEYVNPNIDNGKIYSAHEAVITLTDLDWEIFRQAYNMEDFEVLELWKSRAGYLPFEIIDTILYYYGYKTTLKDGPETETEEELAIRISKYIESKQFINSIYGVSVTKVVTDTIMFLESGWKKIPLDEDGFKEQIYSTKEETTFLSYQLGIWVTAWARFNLWSIILPLDRYVLYGDTDSLFLREGFDISVIEEYNKKNELRQEDVVNYYQTYNKELTLDMYRPKTFKGKVKPLGKFEEEEMALDFRTLGAKRYVLKCLVPKKDEEGNVIEVDGKPVMVEEIQCTIAGLPKEAGRNKIKAVDEFNNKLKWNCKESMKQTAVYNDNQIDAFITDEEGNTYHCVDQFGINIMPVGFDLSLSSEYEMFLKWICNNGKVLDGEEFNQTSELFWNYD